MGELLSFCEGDPFGCRIYSAAKAYGTDKPFASFWFMEDSSPSPSDCSSSKEAAGGVITAVISKLDNGITICAKGAYDTEESDAFVSMHGGGILTLRPAREGETADGVVMKLTGGEREMRECEEDKEDRENGEREKTEEAGFGNSSRRELSLPPRRELSPIPHSSHRPRLLPNGCEAEYNPAVRSLYSVMEDCAGHGFELPSYDEFYGDIIYRRNAGTVASLLIREGGTPAACAAMHLSEKTGLLTLCAVRPDCRGRGLGRAAVRLLLRSVPQREIYVMCVEDKIKYYEGLGFAPVNQFIIHH
jgi:GNAT superfamily N-acetyltransferase